MDPTQLAIRKQIIATTLEEIRSKSKEEQTNEDKTQLETLSPYENASDNEILAITQDEWNSIFPNDQDTRSNGMDVDKESDSKNNEGAEPESDGPSDEDGDDDESEDEFQGPAPRPTRKRQETPKRPRWNDRETDDKDDPEIIDPEALNGFSANGKKDCTTVGRTTKNRYINAYGRKHHCIYKLEDFPQSGCEVDKLPVINGYGKQLGPKKNGGKWVYGPQHVAGVYGIAYQDNVEDDIIGVAALDPKTNNKSPWTTTYILVGWRDPNDQNIVTRCWETRTTARRLWKTRADKLIYNGACQAQMRYENARQGVISRDITPDLIQKYIAQQREESVGLDVYRQPSVPIESITPSIETDSIRNRPNRRGVWNQRSQSTTSFNNQVTGQTEIRKTLEAMQEALMQLTRHLTL
ncbi:hypothetical protein FGRA07_11391 [Fusarium graminearum]|uniref:Uncharacterized protein n=1 Tax=Gibberella zeae TaxID=5518 RepID=A0A2H3FZ25_GIBZA|nr:hypothetical protein FGRA07_11391 [Fusarium graminearum]